VSSQIGRAKKQGLPVDTFRLMKEGAALISQSGSVGLVKDAPHPNAAKVFVNWLLSREGQLTMQKAYVKVGVGASNSFRIDIPKDMIPVEQRLQEGVEYLEVELPEIRAQQRESTRKAIEIMEAALKEAETRRQKSR
jgi:ABC-type Fe3+ transport system substrate-binding protein